MKLKCSGVNIKPGEKICTSCRKSLCKYEKDISDSDDTDEDFVTKEEQRVVLDDSMIQLSCSPIKVQVKI